MIKISIFRGIKKKKGKKRKVAKIIISNRFKYRYNFRGRRQDVFI